MEVVPLVDYNVIQVEINNNNSKRELLKIYTFGN